MFIYIMNVQNLYKLKTKEDPLHIHKMLGVICLFNFIYRFYCLFTEKTMHLDNLGGVGTIVVHGLLSSSSLIFHIPSQRNKAAPMIYPEFRLHSIIFAMRSVVCFLLTYYKFSVFYKFGACYSTMLLADIVTYQLQSQGKLVAVESGTTMRDMPFNSQITELDQREISRLQSANQIGAVLYMFGNLDSCFSPLLAIQLAAFLMTLVRKSIITSNMWHVAYNISLWSGVFVFNSFPASFILEMIVSYYIFRIWRFNMRYNKYIGWTIVFAFMWAYNNWFFDAVQMTFVQCRLENVFRYVCILQYLLDQTWRSRRLFLV